MRVIEAQDVDLIEPFPTSEVKRLLGWLHCYKTCMEVDGDPQTDEEKEAYYKQLLPQVASWGVIDRTNKLGYKHEAPLIGIFFLTPSSNETNVYMHIASTRKAWGSGLMEQAANRLKVYIFDSYPKLLRISGAILTKNKAARNFAKRVGMKQDGLFKDFVTQNGKPLSVAHFGILRNDPWEQKEPPQQLVVPATSLKTSSTPSVSSVDQDSKL